MSVILANQIVIYSAIVFLVLGYEIAARVYRRDAAGFFERLAAAGTLTVASWLLSLWVLGLTHHLTPLALGARNVFIGAVAVALVVARMRSSHGAVSTRLTRPQQAAIGGAGLVLILWIGFVLWRGAVVPPLSHDGLAYHLPKAILFSRAEGYEYFPYLDYRIRKLPVNYELLLTDVVIAEGDDRYTEWISTLFYVLFGVASAALAERWMNLRGVGALTVLMATAGVPVALLHAGAHKNDLMTAAFMVLMLVFAGRWVVQGHGISLVLLILSTAVAVGTKPNAGLLALVLIVPVGWRLIQALRARRLGTTQALALVAGSIAAFLLLGGVVYVQNIAHRNDALQGATASVAPYGDWLNLWQGPFVLLMAPFSPYANLLDVPWSDRGWFWHRYEMYFSHLGIPFAISTVMLPFSRKLSLNSRGRQEGIIMSFAALAVFVIMLPVFFHPRGMYTISLPRYVLFIVPVVFVWTIGAVMARLPSDERLSPLALVLATSVFVTYAVEFGTRDRFLPLSYVFWAHQNRGTRLIPFDSSRAASVLDTLAGPGDAVAIDAGFGTWIHPAFGARLSRPVEFIPEDSGPPRLSARIQWVIVDRSWGVFWGQARIRDLGDAYRFLGRGSPEPADMRVFNYLSKDPAFELLYYNPRRNQAVFHRVNGS